MSSRMIKNGHKFSFKTSKDEENSNAKQTPKFLSIEFDQNSIHKPKSTRNIKVNIQQQDGIYRHQQNSSNMPSTKQNQTAFSKPAIVKKLDNDTYKKSASNCSSNQDFSNGIMRKQQFQSPNINISININNQTKVIKNQKRSSQFERKQLSKSTRQNLNKIWSQPKKYKSTHQNSLNLINTHSKLKPKGISDIWIPSITKKSTDDLNWKNFENNSIINGQKSKTHRSLRIKTQQRSFVPLTTPQSLNRDFKQSPRIKKNLYSPNFKNNTHQIRTNKSQLINLIKLPSPVHKQLPIHLFTKHKEVRVIPEVQLRSPAALQIFKPKNRTKKIMLLKKQIPKNSQYIDLKMQQLNKKLNLLEIQTQFNFDVSD